MKVVSHSICHAVAKWFLVYRNLVLSYRSSSKENNDAGTILSVGSELFYFVIQQITEETNYYPPTRQLFSSFLEILGFEFIANRPAESKRIVSTCIQNPSVVGLLAPHINLVNCEIKSLIDIYQDIINVQKSESDLAFVLLSKVMQVNMIALNNYTYLISLFGSWIFRLGLPRQETVQLLPTVVKLLA